MKKIYALSVTILANVFLFGQTPSWAWAKSAGGTSAEYGQGTAADASGNIYMVGAFQSSTITFGATTLTNSGSFDVFITKYDASGNVVWAHDAGGADFDYGYGIAVDHSSNIYITGWFTSASITFGSTTLTNTGVAGATPSIFIVKYNPAGNVLWAKTASAGTTGASGYSVAVDAICNVYLTGNFQGPLTIGTTTLTNADATQNSTDLFIAKYDSLGNPRWAKRAGGVSGDYGNSVAVDNNGNAFIAGNFSSASITFGSATLINAGAYDLYLTKYDSTGNVLWAKRAGGSLGDGANSVAVDNNGNAYITGLFNSAAIIFGTDTLTDAGSSDVFVAKYDAAGNPLWANGIDGNQSDEAFSIATDNLGNVYVAGAFTSSSLTIGTTTLINAGNYDVFAAAYNTNGNSLWAIGAGDSGYDYGYSICSDTNGNIFVSGYFSSAAFALGATTLTNAAGVADVFIAKLGMNVGVNEIPVSENDVNVFPNPFNNSVDLNFYLAHDDQLKIEVIDLTGKTVQAFEEKEFMEGDNSIEINFSNSELKNGMYLLKIISAHGTIVKKMTRVE